MPRREAGSFQAEAPASPRTTAKLAKLCTSSSLGFLLLEHGPGSEGPERQTVGSCGGGDPTRLKQEPVSAWEGVRKGDVQLGVGSPGGFQVWESASVYF